MPEGRGGGEPGRTLSRGREGSRGKGGWLYPQVVFLLLSLDPAEGLLLRVDAQGEAAGPGGEDAILNGELIGGQSLGAPPGRDSGRKTHFSHPVVNRGSRGTGSAFQNNPPIPKTAQSPSESGSWIHSVPAATHGAHPWGPRQGPTCPRAQDRTHLLTSTSSVSRLSNRNGWLRGISRSRMSFCQTSRTISLRKSHVNAPS